MGVIKCKRKASFTVEASILIPITLFIIVGGINLGFDLFQEARTNIEIHEDLIKLDPVEIVRRNSLFENYK